MKNLFFIAILMVILACGKQEATPVNQINQVINNDSSSFNGKLVVTVFDRNGTSVQSGALVSLYVSYDDVLRRFPLNHLVSENNTGIANFGYLLNGNYYLCAQKGLYADTSIVQVLGQRTIQKSLFLK
jgi:hypothetical protein